MIDIGIHPVAIILMGLAFDIAGASLIVSPLLKLVKTNFPKGEPKGSSMGMIDLQYNYKEDSKSQSHGRLGLGLLATGFVLQGIGMVLNI